MTAVYAAIAAVMADLAKEGISKDRRNKEQGYNFRGIDEVYNALAPILSAHGLAILPTFTERHVSERTTAKGNPLFVVTVRGDFTFVASKDGSQHVVTTYGEAMDTADKATNKAMSAAYKYACMQAFCIPTEGENDADERTHDVAPPRQQAPAKVPPANDGAQADEMARRYKAAFDVKLRACATAQEVRDLWKADAQARRDFQLTADEIADLQEACAAQVRALTAAAMAMA